MFRKQVVPEPEPARTTHIHNHAPSAAGEVVGRVVGGVVLVVLTWFGLVFLADQAGLYQPQAFVAKGLLWLGGAVGLVWLVSHLIGEHLDRYYRHAEAVEEQRTNQMRYRQLLAGSAATDSRALGENKRLATLVYLVMLEAYTHLGKHKRIRGTWRPWSRRSAGKHILTSLNESAPVGEEFASAVRPFLLRAGIIDDNDQIDLKHFPDIASVQRVLYQPVLANPTRLQLGEPSQWSLVE